MFIRYHIIYYAVCALIIVITRYVHPLFLLLYLMYLYFLYYRFNKKLCISIFLFSLIFLLPNTIHPLDEIINGKVIEIKDGYCYFKSKGEIVKLYGDYPYTYGDEMTLKVNYLKMNRATNDYAFDEQTYLKSKNVFYKANIVEVIEYKENNSLYEYMEKLMSNNPIINSYQKLLVFNAQNNEIEETYQQLTELSLVHLFALSGMHMNILYSFLYSVFSLLVNKRISKILTYIVITIYIFSIPLSISLMRAYFMLVLYDLFKKYFNKLDVFALLIIVSLLYNRFIILNISFIFSYFIYFIVLITKQLKYSHIYIFFSTIPILLFLNYQIPLFTILFGLFFNSFIELFYCLCLLSMLFSICEIPLFILIKILTIVLQFLTHISFEMIISKPNMMFIIFYYFIFFVIIYYKLMNKSIQSFICMLLALVFAYCVYSRYKIYGEVTMIDVGQGDCTLIRLPYNQGNILIDTGGNKDYDLATSTIIPYLKSIGIDHLDYVYISHDDYDHCGALDSLTCHFQVNHVIKEFEEYRKIGCMEVYMLEHSLSQESNDQSLVMYVKLPSMNILFTGDASIEVENEILEEYKDLEVDILKVGHHGSSSSTGPNLINQLKPTVAMIGVKENNIYGHPSPIVINRLERKNVTILRTDIDGMFHLRFYNDKNYIIMK